MIGQTGWSNLDGQPVKEKDNCEFKTRVQLLKTNCDASTQKWIVINPIYPTPPLGQDVTQGQFLSRVLQV